MNTTKFISSVLTCVVALSMFPTSVGASALNFNDNLIDVNYSSSDSSEKLDVGDFVSRCYNVALSRDAEEEGYNYWVDKLNNGEACGAQVGYGFIFSDEYINRGRTNAEYLTDLYSMYFDREPDTAGYEYWLSQLDGEVSREEIFAGFANSEEFFDLCTRYDVAAGYYAVGVNLEQQGGVNCFVSRLYKVCLNRLPDLAGQQEWTRKLIDKEDTGASCAFGFVFSPEFTNLGLNEEEFVEYMYRAFFGREADEEGLNYWIGQLLGGAAREDVYRGVAASTEFANLCAKYGIEQGEVEAPISVEPGIVPTATPSVTVNPTITTVPSVEPTITDEPSITANPNPEPQIEMSEAIKNFDIEDEEACCHDKLCIDINNDGELECIIYDVYKSSRYDLQGTFKLDVYKVDDNGDYTILEELASHSYDDYPENYIDYIYYDGHYYLCLYKNGNSSDFSTTLYGWYGDKLEPIFDTASEIDHNSVKDNMVEYTERHVVTHTQYWWTAVTIDYDAKKVSKVEDYVHIAEGYTHNEQLTLMSDIILHADYNDDYNSGDSDPEAVTLPGNQKIRFTKASPKYKCLFVEAEDGSTGWVYVDEYEDFKSYLKGRHLDD